MNRRGSERGFSLIELMIVLSIISLLVRVSLPAYDSIRRDAIATHATGELNSIRAAAIAQFEATGSYPPDAPGGTMPPGMAPYLPRGFTFRPVHYELDWDNYTVADSTAGPSGTGQILALTVTADDPRVGRQILRMLGANCTHWTVGDSHTFVVLSTLEAPR